MMRQALELRNVSALTDLKSALPLTLLRVSIFN